MVPYDRFTVVLDACTLFPMLARDVLLTLAAHEFFSPEWSARIRDEWTRNLLAQMQERSTDGDAQKRVDRIVAAMTAPFRTPMSMWSWLSCQQLSPWTPKTAMLSQRQLPPMQMQSLLST